MIKKIVASSIISILVLFTSINVKAAAFTDNQVVAANKSWAIHFNDEVSLDDLTKQGISVADSKGNNVSVTFDFGKDNKTIIVNAPTGSYKAGEKYKLLVSNKVHNKNNKNIGQPVTLNFSIESDTKNTIVLFKDKNLEQLVRENINKPSGDIYSYDVEKIKELDCTNKGIEDISGLEYLKNLEKLNLTYNKISDITPLSKLTNIKELTLRNDNIGDLEALSNLINLEKLDIGNYRESAFWNTYSDISSLYKLSKLKELNLTYTDVDDIDVVKNFKDLNTFIYRIFNSRVTDISALKDLIELKYLDLEYVNVSNIDQLSGLKNLTYLNLNSTLDNSEKINDITMLKDMTSLTELYLNSSDVKDISALTNAVNMEKLDLSNNDVSDVSPVRKMIKLQNLWLYNDPINSSDIQELNKDLPDCKIEY